MTTTMREICEQYKQVHVPAVCDALDNSFGLWGQIMSKDIRPLKIGQKLAGPAFTMLGIKSRDVDKNRRLIVKAVDEIQSGMVAAISTGGDDTTGHWGELLSNAAIQRGATGVVLDGGVRDTGAILELDLPVFHRYFYPGDSTGRFNIIEYQTPIILGGVDVNPGDFIFGDCDGVVVVPKDLIEPVLRKAQEIVETEKEIRARVKSGESVASLFMEYEQF